MDNPIRHAIRVTLLAALEACLVAPAAAGARSGPAGGPAVPSKATFKVSGTQFGRCLSAAPLGGDTLTLKQVDEPHG